MGDRARRDRAWPLGRSNRQQPPLMPPTASSSQAPSRRVAQRRRRCPPRANAPRLPLLPSYYPNCPRSPKGAFKANPMGRISAELSCRGERI